MHDYLLLSAQAWLPIKVQGYLELGEKSKALMQGGWFCVWCILSCSTKEMSINIFFWFDDGLIRPLISPSWKDELFRT